MLKPSERLADTADKGKPCAKTVSSEMKTQYITPSGDI